MIRCFGPKATHSWKTWVKGGHYFLAWQPALIICFDFFHLLISFVQQIFSFLIIKNLFLIDRSDCIKRWLIDWLIGWLVFFLPIYCFLIHFFHLQIVFAVFRIIYSHHCMGIVPSFFYEHSQSMRKFPEVRVTLYVMKLWVRRKTLGKMNILRRPPTLGGPYPPPPIVKFSNGPRPFLKCGVCFWETPIPHLVLRNMFMLP